jgi:hypothetical protein
MKNKLLKLANNLPLIALACLTLGLAPFAPEPHVWQKLSWLYYGNNTLLWYDWFDLFLHGSPWVLLFLGVYGKLFLTPKEQPKP